jgi:hypothetical protein
MCLLFFDKNIRYENAIRCQTVSGNCRRNGTARLFASRCGNKYNDKFGYKKCIPVTAVLMLSSAAVSLKKQRVTPAVIAFSKSGFTNKTIHALFFISRSTINNGPLVLFNLIVLKGLAEFFLKCENREA